MSKIAAPSVSFPTFEALWGLVGKQVVKEKAVGQRSHRSRIASGRARHTQATRLGKTAPTTQTIIQIARVTVGKRKTAELRLIDGYHRLTEWSEHGCPFDQLVVIEHSLIAADMNQLDDVVDSLMRTIDSKAAVKGSPDYYTGAIEDAKLTVQSKAYTKGENALSFFKRVIGDSKKLTARELREQFLKKSAAHEAMDDLFAYAENRSVMSAADRKRVLHPGVVEAIFHFMVRYGASYKQVCELKLVLAIASESPVLKSVGRIAAATEEVGEKLRHLASVSETKRIHSGCNKERFYDKFRDELAPILLRLNRI